MSNPSSISRDPRDRQKIRPTPLPIQASADGLSILGLRSFLRPDEGCAKAKKLALQALEMDGSLAEAHAAAWATMHYDYNFSAAERSFERSIELNPRYATAHEWFGFSLAVMGRYEEGYTELKRAIRLDPCSSAYHWALGFVYWRARRIRSGNRSTGDQQEGARVYSKFHSSPPGNWCCLLENVCILPAIAALQRADELSLGAPIIIGYLGAVYAAAGNWDAAHKILHQLTELSKERYVSPYLVGRIYAALGKKDEALHWLETAYEERAEWMVLLKTENWFR